MLYAVVVVGDSRIGARRRSTGFEHDKPSNPPVTITRRRDRVTFSISEDVVLSTATVNRIPSLDRE